MLRPILATTLLLAACGGDGYDTADQPAEGPAEATAAETAPAVAITNSPETIVTATFAPEFGIKIEEFEHNDAGLYWKDHAIGDGKTATVGSQANVKYDGKLPNGTRFDSGVYQFTIGARQVIDGWDQGIKGMKVGGKRTLIVPPTLGYGPAANGPIPANATLVFEVELLEVQ